MGHLGAVRAAHFRERTFPGSGGRLRPPLLVDADHARYESEAKQHRVDFAARYSHSIGAWDLGIYYFGGTGREPRLLPSDDSDGAQLLIPYYQLIDQVGVDLQVVAGGWLLRLEPCAGWERGTRSSQAWAASSTRSSASGAAPWTWASWASRHTTSVAGRRRRPSRTKVEQRRGGRDRVPRACTCSGWLGAGETGTLLALGEVALMRGRASAAEERLEWVCRTNPRAVGGFFLRALLAWRAGDVEGAGQLLEQARQARGPDWKPVGATAEGDVERGQHRDTTPLSRFWLAWDGAGPPEAFEGLEAFLASPFRAHPDGNAAFR